MKSGMTEELALAETVEEQDINTVVPSSGCRGHVMLYQFY